jgi:outer membrane lipoprotein-sorting protein
MQRITWIAAIVICVSVVLAGCGQKDAGDVVKELEKTAKELKSYQAKAKMTIHTGDQPQSYDVSVWYQEPHYYRIELTNPNKDITQIVLRNDEGVFVLTPHLNKSFRFQSDWPNNQGQAYLYQTLVQGVLADNSRQFVAEKDSYMFDVLANYNNGSLSRQKIWLSKKDYAPVKVEVSDINANVLVDVKFTQFEFGRTFEKADFDMQRNMTGWNLESVPALMDEDAHDHSTDKSDADGADGSDADADGADKSDADANSADDSDADAGSADKSDADTDSADKGNTDANSADDSDADAGSADKSDADTDSADKGNTDANSADDSNADTGSTDKSDADGAEAGAEPVDKEASAMPDEFGILEPTYTPDGVALDMFDEVELGDSKGIMLRYVGAYNYTLLESRPMDRAVSLVPGKVLDLGFTIGHLAGEEKRTLTWTYNGLEFRLSSDDLPEAEMVRIAQSIPDESTK